MIFLLYLPALIFLLLFYFRLAVQFKIIDKPNERSSHSRITIRGAGIIFPIALFLHFLISGFQYPLFYLGLMLISLISFYDDLQTVSNKIRLFIHLIAVSLLFLEAGLMNYPLWIIFLAFILVIGTINAYNFMDGINGLTGVYSFVTTISLFYVNEYQSRFLSSDLLIVTGIALIVFSIFNFRKIAKCFAGDAGSISMAFILIYFLILLILATGEVKYIGLFLLYGLDTITTIIFRLIRRENIFLAHRSHFYQFLVNSKLWPHTMVSLVYGVLQLIINILILSVELDLMSFLLLLIVSGCVVIGLRFQLEGKAVLIHKKKIMQNTRVFMHDTKFNL